MRAPAESYQAQCFLCLKRVPEARGPPPLRGEDEGPLTEAGAGVEANCAANWQTPANHRGPTAPAEGDPASEAHLCLPVPLATDTKMRRQMRAEPSQGLGTVQVR